MIDLSQNIETIFIIKDYLVSDRNPALRTGADLWSEDTVRADDVASTALPDLGGGKRSVQLLSYTWQIILPVSCRAPGRQDTPDT